MVAFHPGRRPIVRTAPDYFLLLPDQLPEPWSPRRTAVFLAKRWKLGYRFHAAALAFMMQPIAARPADYARRPKLA
jgi:hypothetical protein